MAMAPASKPHSNVCTQYQHLCMLDTAVSSVTSRNVISRLVRPCKLSDAKSKGQVLIAQNVSFVCPTEIYIVLCVSVLAGEVPMSSISVTLVCLTYVTPISCRCSKLTGVPSVLSMSGGPFAEMFLPLQRLHMPPWWTQPSSMNSSAEAILKPDRKINHSQWKELFSMIQIASV